jgi:hypothetical protein
MTLTIREAGINARLVEIVQQKEVLPEVNPPIVLSSVVNNSAPRKLIVTFDKDITLSGLNGISVSNNSVTDYTVSGNIVTFTLSNDVNAGTIQTWTYDNEIPGASLTSIKGVQLESGTFEIENNVGVVRDEYSDAYSLAFAGGYATVAEPPVMLSWVIENDTPNIVNVKWDKPLTGTTGITVSGIIVNSLSFNSVNMDVTLERDATAGEALTLSYSPGDLIGDNGELVVASGPHDITNNVVSATPPNAVDDSATVDQGGTVVIDILANDLDGDNPIDTTTVQIGTAFSFGNYSVDPATGEVTYTNTSDGETADYGTYTVADNAGNRSQSARIDISINIEAPISPHVRITNMGKYTGN